MNQDALALRIALRLGRDYNCRPEDFLDVARRISGKIATGEMVNVGQAKSDSFSRCTKAREKSKRLFR